MKLKNLRIPDKKRETFRNSQDIFTPYYAPDGVTSENHVSAVVNDSAFFDQVHHVHHNHLPAAASLFEEGIGFPGYPFLSQLSLRGEYRLIVETRAEEATRQWIRLKRTGKIQDNAVDLEKVSHEFTRLNIQDLFKKALCTEGYFGLAHIYVDLETARNDPEEKTAPLFLTSRKIRQGELNGFKVIDPNWVTPVTYNTLDPFADDFYNPSLWWVLGQQIHASRLITLVSQPVPDILKPAYNFGGVPFAFMAKPYVDNWLRTRQSVSDLIKSFSTMVLKTDLSQLLSPGCEELSKRAELMAAYRDNRGLQIVDNESEDLLNIATPLSGLDKLQAQSQEHMAAISGIPLVKLLGITPSGLNASSDGEIRCFYDRISAFQESVLRKPVQMILEIIQLNLFGRVDPDISFEFNPLWQLDEVQQSQIHVNHARTVGEYLQNGIINKTEGRQAIHNMDSQLFSNIDWDQSAF